MIVFLTVKGVVSSMDSMMLILKNLYIGNIQSHVFKSKRENSVIPNLEISLGFYYLE